MYVEEVPSKNSVLPTGGPTGEPTLPRILVGPSKKENVCAPTGKDSQPLPVAYLTPEIVDPPGAELDIPALTVVGDKLNSRTEAVEFDCT